MNVFGVAELCVEILLYVDELDLLRLQQVCHPIKNHITKDPVLQRRLFFESSETVIDNSHAGVKNTMVGPDPIQFNPFFNKLSTISPLISWCNRIRPEEKPYNGEFLAEPEEELVDLRNAHFRLYPPIDGRPESRWNDMFATKPPVTTIAMEIVRHRNNPESRVFSKDYRIFNPAGVTIGEVVTTWKRATNRNEYTCEEPYRIFARGFKHVEPIGRDVWMI